MSLTTTSLSYATKIATILGEDKEEKSKSLSQECEFKSADQLINTLQQVTSLLKALELNPNEIKIEKTEESSPLNNFKKAIEVLKKNRPQLEDISLQVEVGEFLKKRSLSFLETNYKKIGITDSIPYNKLANFFTLFCHPESLAAFLELTPTQSINMQSGIRNFMKLHFLTLDLMLFRLEPTFSSYADEIPKDAREIAKRDSTLLIDKLNDEKNYAQTTMTFAQFIAAVFKGTEIPADWKRNNEQRIKCQEVEGLVFRQLDIEVSSSIFNLVQFQNSDSEVLFKKLEITLNEYLLFLNQNLGNGILTLKEKDDAHIPRVAELIKECQNHQTLFKKLNSRGESANTVKQFIARIQSIPSLKQDTSLSLLSTTIDIGTHTPPPPLYTTHPELQGYKQSTFTPTETTATEPVAEQTQETNLPISTTPPELTGRIKILAGLQKQSTATPGENNEVQQGP